MSYCPTCKQKFDSDATECPEDRVALVDELPFQSIDGPTSTWVEIAGVGTEEEARILRGFLDAEGIPCQVESLRSDAMPTNLGTLSEIRVYVAAENEAQAQQLLAERRRDYKSLPTDESVMTDAGPASIDDNSETVTETEES